MFTMLRNRLFENVVGKGENAGNHNVFVPETEIFLKVTLDLSSAYAFNLVNAKILLYVFERCLWLMRQNEYPWSKG